MVLIFQYDHQSLVLIDVVFTSSGICKKNTKETNEKLWTETAKDSVIFRFGSYFVHGEADGVHVLTLTPISAAVLLHEGHQETARHLVIVRIVILLQQRDLKLGVNPKCVCRYRVCVSLSDLLAL